MVYQGLPIKNGWIFHGYVSHNQMDGTWNCIDLGRGALDLAVAYLKNYAVDKADALYTATEPFCNAVTKEKKRLGRSLRFVWIHDHMISYAYRMSSRPSLIKYSCWRSNQLMIMQSDVTIHANNYLLKLTIHAC